jgi:CHASE2 domain-containing sensor protein
MFRGLERMIPKTSAGRSRLVTAVIFTIAAAMLLAGGGTRFIDSYERFHDANAITSVALVMGGVPREALPVTLLDVDDRTREAWGAGPRTPHAALARLITESASHGASAVVVDFDLSSETPAETADPLLHEALANYPASAPPLMLARKISFGRDGGEEPVAVDTLGTPYDDAVAGKANIHWITTLNDISGDRQVKRIRLWQTVCKGPGGIAYPSAALVAGALLFPDAQKAAELDAFLKARADSDCRKTAATDVAWPIATAQAATLPYVIPDRAENRALFRISREGRETVVLRRIPAGQLVSYGADGAKVAGELDRDPFEGRVVMIGASHSDSGDFYNTPIGSMPGVLILANSVVQARKIVDAAPMPVFLTNIITLLVFLIFAYVARKLQGAPAVIVIGLLSVPILFAVSRFYSFADGVTILGVAVPGFALFKLIDSCAHIVVHLPSLGWRALLKK